MPDSFYTNPPPAQPPETQTSFMRKQYDEHTKHLSMRDILAGIITATGCVQVLASMVIPGVVIESNFMIFWATVIGYYFNKETKPISTPTVKTN